VSDVTVEFERREPLAGAVIARPSQGAVSVVDAERLHPAVARRVDLVTLRIVLCGCIILLHAGAIFSTDPVYHLKSELTSPVVTVLVELLRVTSVPLFFVVAGWSAVASLRTRRPGAFVHERMRRLVVPFVFGSLLFGSIIKYVELSHGRDIGFFGFRLISPLPSSFLEFFPHNLLRIKEMTWSHLWFLGYLFLISLLLLPLLAQLARAVPRMTMPAAPLVYLPALALAGFLAAFDGYWPYLPNLVTDGTNFTYFALCFAAGAAMAAWPGFEARLHAETPGMLALLLAGAIGVALCGPSTVGRLFVGLAAWGMIGTGLGVAGRVKPPAAFAYLAEASMPVFIMHEVPVLLIGLVVIPLALPVGLSVALVFVSATLVTLVAYHWLIRPWPVARRLMGMDAGRA
jgi:surface polysaccharide O-acyltransferase-like enzyme